MSILNQLLALRIRRHQLSGWSALREPRSIGGDYGLMLPSRWVASVFEMAFPHIEHTNWREFNKGVVGCFLQNVIDFDIQSIRDFLELIKKCVPVQDLLEASFALDFNFCIISDRLQRTEVGELVHSAKPYDGPVTDKHRQQAAILGDRVASFVESNPCFTAVDSIVAVPTSNPKRNYSLPRILADMISCKCQIPDLSDALTKATATQQLKTLAREDKVRALVGSVKVSTSSVQGRTILVVDDLYQSGTTINYVGLELLGAGAIRVFGLAAAKTMRDSDNLAHEPSGGSDERDSFDDL